MCSQVCPSRIDVMHKTSVVSPECIGCWRCVSFCRFNEALSMRFAGRLVIPGIVFALLVVAIFWGGTLIGKTAGLWQTDISLQEYRRLLAK
jgi:ferredoxin